MILIITGILKKLNLKNIQYQFKKDPFLQKYAMLLKIKLSKKDTFLCAQIVVRSFELTMFTSVSTADDRRNTARRPC